MKHGYAAWMDMDTVGQSVRHINSDGRRRSNKADIGAFAPKAAAPAAAARRRNT